jgi:predicted rRNA methylase YqxC with S4 and FtsJ domains
MTLRTTIIILLLAIAAHHSIFIIGISALTLTSSKTAPFSPKAVFGNRGMTTTTSRNTISSTRCSAFRSNRVISNSKTESSLTSPSTDSNKIFVSGLRRNCNEDDLMNEFAKYGKIKSIEMINTYNKKSDNSNNKNDDDKNNDDGNNQEKKLILKIRKRKPFAFVTFESDDVTNHVVSKFSAVDNIDTNTSGETDVQSDNTSTDNDAAASTAENANDRNSPLFTIVKHAQPIVPRYAKHIKKSLQEQKEILQICNGMIISDEEVNEQNLQEEWKQPNLLLQVHSSHLDRMIQYVKDLDKFPANTINNADADTDCSNTNTKIPVPIYIGSSFSNAKNISFLFLHVPSTNAASPGGHRCSNRLYWYNHLISNPILTRFTIRKVYEVDQYIQIQPHGNSQEKDFDEKVNSARADLIVTAVLDWIEIQLNDQTRSSLPTNNDDKDKDSTSTSGEIILKGQTFAPKVKKNLQEQIVTSFGNQIEKISFETQHATNKDSEDTTIQSSSFQSQYPNIYQRKLSMSTSDYTHLFSCVQVFHPSGQIQHKEAKDSLNEIYMIGVSPTYENNQIGNNKINADINTNQNDNNTNNGSDNDSQERDQNICRAYFKLKEVMDNYRRDEKDINIDFKGINAFDCGSSPGGWTKFLLQDEDCNQVFSCDPGHLDPSVKAMEGVRHLQMRGFDAIDLLSEEQKVVNLWVSDMCLLDPKHQIDHLVLAKEKGILAEKAFFILTLKFNTGHSKDTFDLFAKEELDRLREKLKVDNVQVYHLFSNRKGERTVVGRLV